MDARRSKVTAKILDKSGREVPKSEYDVDMTDSDFSFKFKKPGRGKSGKYTIVLANDAGETEKDVYVNFLGNFLTSNYNNFYISLAKKSNFAVVWVIFYLLKCIYPKLRPSTAAYKEKINIFPKMCDVMVTIFN